MHAWAGVSQTQSIKTKTLEDLDLFYQVIYGMYVYKLKLGTRLDEAVVYRATGL